jgi:hypothetical protein
MLATIPSDTFPKGMKTLPEGWDLIEEDLTDMIRLAQMYFGVAMNRVLTSPD